MTTEHFNYYNLEELMNSNDAEVLVAESNEKLTGSQSLRKSRLR